MSIPLQFERQPIRRPVVDRIDESSVRIRWPESFSGGPVSIFRGIDPSLIDRSQPLAVAEGQTVKLTRSDDPRVGQRHRLYYELVPSDGGEPVVTSERRLPLACCNNFRDLGGYETEDGRVVRWNRLYRANALSKLAPSDTEYLSGLGIKLVCDFRSDRERFLSPNSLIGRARQVDLPVDQEGVDPEEMRRKIRTGGLVGLGVEATMRNAYRAFVTEYSAVWAAMFWRIARPENIPSVVHCTAGKDRTGFASALVLYALGVPEQTIVEDYLLTNYYMQNLFRFVLRWVPLYSFFRTEPEDLLPLLEARRQYLQTSLDAIKESYGSIDAYLEQALGVDDRMRAQLEQQFLD
jgi:protein-tyrosine phosphatase